MEDSKNCGPFGSHVLGSIVGLLLFGNFHINRRTFHPGFKATRGIQPLVFAGSLSLCGLFWAGQLQKGPRCSFCHNFQDAGQTTENLLATRSDALYEGCIYIHVACMYIYLYTHLYRLYSVLAVAVVDFMGGLIGLSGSFGEAHCKTEVDRTRLLQCLFRPPCYRSLGLGLYY